MMIERIKVTAIAAEVKAVEAVAEVLEPAKVVEAEAAVLDPLLVESITEARDGCTRMIAPMTVALTRPPAEADLAPVEADLPKVAQAEADLAKVAQAEVDLGLPVVERGVVTEGNITLIHITTTTTTEEKGVEVGAVEIAGAVQAADQLAAVAHPDHGSSSYVPAHDIPVRIPDPADASTENCYHSGLSFSGAFTKLIAT